MMEKKKSYLLRSVVSWDNRKMHKGRQIVESMIVQWIKATVILGSGKILLIFANPSAGDKDQIDNKPTKDR